MSELIIILGRRGYGKTTYAHKYLDTHGMGNPIFIYDPLMSVPNTKWYEDTDELSDDEIEVGLKQKVQRYGTFSVDSIPDMAALSLQFPPSILMIEETSTAWVKGGRLDKDTSRAVFLGRHYRNTAIFIAQRASSIPIDVRSQATQVVTFGQRESDDLEWLQDFFGDKIEDIPNLKKFEYYHFIDTDEGEPNKYTLDKPKATDNNPDKQVSVSTVLTNLLTKSESAK